MSDRANRLYPTQRPDGTQVMIAQTEVLREDGSASGRGSIIPAVLPSTLTARLLELGMPAEEVEQIFQELFEEWRANMDSQGQDRSRPPNHRYMEPPR